MPKSIVIVCCFLMPYFVAAQTADFTFQSADGLFCNPSLVQFTQTSTGNPTSFIWNLGNGLKTSTPNPLTSYTNPGTYTIKLIAIFPDGPREISKTITVAPSIIPNISADRDYICQPGTINFSVSSNGNINSYDWSFSDSAGNLSTNNNTTSHNFTAYGSYTAAVKVTDAGGCFGYDTVNILVEKILITANANLSSGCIPATVQFTSSSKLPLNDAVASYSWDFGDGSSPAITPDSVAVHQYTSVNTLFPKLLVSTNEGCTNTFDFPATAFGTPPVNLVTYTKKSLFCGSESPDFVAKATNANRYSWDFGDSVIVSVTDTVTNHKYSTVGIKTVTVTPYFNDCPGVADSFQIEVIGVIAKFTYTPITCTDKKTDLFNDKSVGGVTSVSWNFGDGTDTSQALRPTHQFPNSGQFTTVLTAIDTITGCQDKDSVFIFTADPIVVNSDTTICRNALTTFTISNNYTNPEAYYIWHVLGKRIVTDRRPTVTLKADTLGFFSTNFLVTRAPHYCDDTIYLDHSILVRGPDLNFTVPGSTCFGDFINISNNSKPFITADSVTLWYWNYGNSFSNDTVYQPQPLQYNTPNTFPITLTAIDINGCKDSLVKSVIVSPLPFLNVSPTIDTLCFGQFDTLFASHTDSVLWSPSNGLSCITCDTVVANPTTTTQYFITAYTPFNCRIIDSVMIYVIQPFEAIAAPDSVYICLNEEAILDINPKNKRIDWSPSVGLSNTQIYNPVVKPTGTTTYTAALTDSVGCFSSSADVTIFVKRTPSVNAGPDQLVAYNANFTISPVYSSNVASYMWTPSSLLSCSDCAMPGGIGSYSETYTIKVTSDSGCVATDSISILVECKSANIFMPGAFTPNNDNLNDYYYPITRGIKSILKFIIFNREGKIVYQAQNFSPNSKSFAWNGQFKGINQPQGAYVYVLEALCELGERLSQSASFMLLR